MLNSKNEYNGVAFKAADFFMLRTPLLPVEIYNQLFNKDLSSNEVEKKLIEIADDKVIKEAIAVSSLSLNKALKLLDNKKNNKRREQVLSSLLKYIIRMTTRTTPYGLFSGVTLGYFSEKTEIKLKDRTKYIKRARPDMEWLYAIMRKLENDEEILSELKVIRNSLIIVNGSRLDISYISNYGQVFKGTSVDNITASVRYNEQLRFVMEIAKDPIKYKDLLSLIKQRNKNIPIEIIKKFLNQLLKNEYLITEMRPALVNTLPFEYIISKLANIKAAEKVYIELIEIGRLINIYNTLSIGEGEILYKDIVKKMEELEECKNYLQVDLRLKEDTITLNNKVAQEFEKVIEILLRVSSKSSSYIHLTKYMNDFIDKYGTDKEISVIELLDEDKGIGAPAGYDKPASSRCIEDIPENLEDKKVKSYFLNKVIKALMNEEKEIIITDDEVNKLQDKDITEYDADEIPQSLEINALISANNKKSLDEGNFTIFIGPNYGSTGAGKTFGRFVDILPNEIYDKLDKLNKAEKNMTREDIVFAELVELPQSGRLSNVSINWNARDYEIAISTNYSEKKEKINVSDLYIGIDRDDKEKFYIKSKSLNKKVIITSNHMLNVTFGSNVYRFLREVSLMNSINIMDKLYNNGLSDLNYVPRIKYRKVVLLPATWKLSQNILNINMRNSEKNDFYEAIKSWREKWNVPKLIYQKENDNRLLLNLCNQAHLDELFSLFKKNIETELTITEIEDGLEKLWVRGEEGTYFSEIVVPIIRNDQFFKKISKSNNIISKIEMIETKSDYKNNCLELNDLGKKKKFIPGDDWIYLKLYGNSKRIDEFIGYEMFPFCQELLSNEHIEKFFFIRYADPEKHVRLRLKGGKNHMYSMVMTKLNFWFNHLIEEGLTNRVVIDTYFPEIERYGGPKLIDLAENVFYTDSVFVSNIINLKRSGQLKLDLSFIAVISIINLLEELKISYEIQNNIFLNNFDRNSYRELFQKDRKTFIKIGNSNDNWSELRKVEGGEILYQLFEMRKQSINSFADKMNVIDTEGELWNSKLNIILSIIHMHCNRLLGSTQLERRIMCLVRHTLQSLGYTKNY